MLIDVVSKQPRESETYTFDYTDFLGDDTIATFTCTADSTAIDVQSVAVGKYANVKVSAGLDGERYKLTLLMTSSSGRIKEDELKVKVKDV